MSICILSDNGVAYGSFDNSARALHTNMSAYPLSVRRRTTLYIRAVNVLHFSADFRESTPIAPPLRLEILTTSHLTTVTKTRDTLLQERRIYNAMTFPTPRLPKINILNTRVL